MLSPTFPAPACSGQPIYNDFYMTMFNVVFTATAPLVVGWFDRDLDKGYGPRFPLLYREGARCRPRTCALCIQGGGACVGLEQAQNWVVPTPNRPRTTRRPAQRVL